MITQEDKYIANQLNSLDTLPEGYQANLSSKWEMVEMGMEQKKKRLPVYSLLAAAACLLLMIGAGYFYMLGKKQNDTIAKEKVKQETGTIAKKTEPTLAPNEIPSVTVDVNANKPITPKIVPAKKVVITINKSSIDTISIASNIPVQEIIQSTAQQKPSIDSSNNIASATAQPLIKKTKQRFFQMDFGDGTPNDAVQKTASSKILQFRFSSKTQSDGIPSSTKTGLPKLVQPL